MSKIALIVVIPFAIVDLILINVRYWRMTHEERAQEEARLRLW